jgi:hypothetical protein
MPAEGSPKSLEGTKAAEFKAGNLARRKSLRLWARNNKATGDHPTAKTFMTYAQTEDRYDAVTARSDDTSRGANSTAV